MLASLLAASLALTPARAQEAVPSALTLERAYELALKWSETLAQRGETAASLAARERELWSYLG